MKVHLEQVNKRWRIILIPEDSIEGEILKTKGGAIASLVKDMKIPGSHIPDCLVIEDKAEGIDNLRNSDNTTG